jgi:hypothetical protein
MHLSLACGLIEPRFRDYGIRLIKEIRTDIVGVLFNVTCPDVQYSPGPAERPPP